MRKTVNVFVIESPFQMLSALEAVRYFALDNNVLFMRISGNSRNNEQLGTIANYGDWIKIIPFETAKLRDLAAIKRSIREIRKNYEIGLLFLGEFYSPVITAFGVLFSSTKIYVLDDGAGSLEIWNYYHSSDPKQAKRFMHASLNNRIKAMVNCLLRNWPGKKRKVIYLFSCFDLTSNQRLQVTKHNFDFTRSKTSTLTEQKNDTLFFLGSCACESGVVTEEYYEQCISKVAALYKDMHLVYLPHRHERADKIASRVAPYGFEIKYLDSIVELGFCELQERPRYVASFLSTALYSLKMIFPEADVTAFLYDESQINQRYRAQSLYYYSYYESYLNLIRLSDVAGERI